MGKIIVGSLLVIGVCIVMGLFPSVAVAITAICIVLLFILSKND